jgi:uncharacterized membrane-anchored protein
MVARVGVMVGAVVVGFANPAPSAAAPAAADLAIADPVSTSDDTVTALQGTLPPHLTGPRLVALGDNAEVDLPAGMILYERAEAQRFLRKVGSPSEGVVAIVRAPDAEWSVIVSYTGASYLDDAGASELDARDLLAEYRAGNRIQNERRRALGAPERDRELGPELVIDGWAEPPRYDRAQHRLTWGLAAHTAGGRLANSFTRILGRRGYLSVNLIDSAATIGLSKLQARSIVQATRFKPGARYQDHAPGDPRADGRLRGLVLGSTGAAVAAKLGVITQVMLALKQVTLLLLVGLLVIGGLFRRLFRRRQLAAMVDPTARADRAERIDDATGAAEVADSAAGEGADTEELAAVDLIAFYDQTEAAAASPISAADEVEAGARSAGSPCSVGDLVNALT